MVVTMTPSDLATRILETPFTGTRRVVAIAGPPASGKSTLASDITALDASFALVPMDGFHLDNATLDARNLRHRKGAPNTFDAAGFVALVAQLQTQSDVPFPLFDRSLDVAVPNAGLVQSHHQTVLVEGNYLLLDQPIWRDLVGLWDLSIFLRPGLDILHTRLLDRWRSHGFSDHDADAKARLNDLPNAQTVLDGSLPADIYLPS